MSRALDLLRPNRVRLIGVVIALIVLVAPAALPAGLSVSLPFDITIATTSATARASFFLDARFVIATLAVWVALCWPFAERAVRPGPWNAYKAALGVTLSAVGLTVVAVVVAAAIGAGGDHGAPFEGLSVVHVWLLAVAFLAFFIPAIIWAALLRVTVRLLGAGAARAA